MRSGDKVICLKSSGDAKAGKAYTVKHSCVAINRMTLEMVSGIFRRNLFMLDSPENRRDIRAGQWWITRGVFLVLVNHRDGDKLLVSVPCSVNGCKIEPYHSDGRYAESAETEFDLIRLAPVGMDCKIGELMFSFEMDVDAAGAANDRRPVSV